MTSLVNFAAESHVDRSIIGATDFIQTNVLGAQQVFEAALRHDVQRVVHISTDEVYGSIPVGSWTEDHVLEPNSPYSAAKAGGDLMARAYAKTYGLNISITRCSNNYGPYHFPEKVIPLFVTNLLDGKKVPLYGEGLNVRDWLFVADHCRGVQLVVEQGRPGEFYNIGGGRELSNKELTQLLLDATGRTWDYVQHIVDPRGGGHDLRYSVDYGKIAELGYAPQMSFEDGLALTVDWYRTNRDVVGTAQGAGRDGQGSVGQLMSSRMRWLITGAHGQLGSDLRRISRATRTYVPRSRMPSSTSRTPRRSR